MNRYLYLGVGFGIWAAATLAVRLIGQVLFLPDNAVIVAALYIVVGIALPLLAYGIYIWRRLDPIQQIEAAALLVIPGMLADAFVVLFFAPIFPNVTPEADGLFGAWLLWAYVVVLITGFIRLPVQRQRA